MSCENCVNYGIYAMITSGKPYGYSGDIPCNRCSRYRTFEDLYAPISKPSVDNQKKEPYQPPKSSNHLRVNYIAVGYYKHEIDFGVLGSVQELSDTDFQKMLDMLQTAIKVAKEMRVKAEPT